MTTLTICKNCENPFIEEEVKEFILTLGLPLEGMESAAEHNGELCIYCMRDQISKDTGIPFITVYEVVLQEKIMLWNNNY